MEETDAWFTLEQGNVLGEDYIRLCCRDPRLSIPRFLGDGFSDAAVTKERGRVGGMRPSAIRVRPNGVSTSYSA